MTCVRLHPNSWMRNSPLKGYFSAEDQFNECLELHLFMVTTQLESRTQLKELTAK